jgi:hypothetical protein
LLRVLGFQFGWSLPVGGENRAHYSFKHVELRPRNNPGRKEPHPPSWGTLKHQTCRVAELLPSRTAFWFAIIAAEPEITVYQVGAG